MCFSKSCSYLGNCITSRLKQKPMKKPIPSSVCSKFQPELPNLKKYPKDRFRDFHLVYQHMEILRMVRLLFSGRTRNLLLNYSLPSWQVSHCGALFILHTSSYWVTCSYSTCKNAWLKGKAKHCFDLVHKGLTSLSSSSPTAVALIRCFSVTSLNLYYYTVLKVHAYTKLWCDWKK